MNTKQSLQPVSREVTDKYLQKTTQFFWVDESIQPNFYEAVFKMCEQPQLIKTGTSRSLGLYEDKKNRYCVWITGGAKDFNIRLALFYTNVHIIFRSVRGLAKFIALHILLSENNIKVFPL